MKLNYLLFVSLITALTLQGCGGGGGKNDSFEPGPTYSGLTTEAKVDATSSLDLINAAVSGGSKAVEAFLFTSELFPDSALRFGSKSLAISPRIASLAGKTGVIYSAKPIDVSADVCPGGGSATEDINDSETVALATFRDCVDDVGFVLNGTVNLTYIPAQDSLTGQTHLSISYEDYSRRFDWTVACTDISSSPSCEISSDFIGVDSRLYRLGNAFINGDEFSGYDITATVYDPDHGHFDMTTSGAIFYDCYEEWIPSTGAITISGANGSSADINFNSCSEYTVTIDGVGNTYTW